MRAGELRHRIEIDIPQTAQNDMGEEIVTWTPYATVWGKIEPLRGREALRSHAIAADFDTRILIRWSPNLDAINAKWRLRYRNTIYNIQRILNVDVRNREIEIWANSGLNEG